MSEFDRIRHTVEMINELDILCDILVRFWSILVFGNHMKIHLASGRKIFLTDLTLNNAWSLVKLQVRIQIVDRAE